MIGSDERVLAWATTTAGPPMVATNLGLWWPGEPPRRIDWFRLDKVVWSEQGFFVTEADVVDDLLLVDRVPLRADLDVPGKLPAQVRKRVESSIVRTYDARLSDGSARIVGRKVPGEDGLRWWAHLTPGTPDTPSVRAELVALIGPLRAESAARLSEL